MRFRTRSFKRNEERKRGNGAPRSPLSLSLSSSSSSFLPPLPCPDQVTLLSQDGRACQQHSTLALRDLAARAAHEHWWCVCDVIVLYSYENCVATFRFCIRVG
jgi:hypothetical protein